MDQIHLKYKDKLVEFFLFCCQHKEIEMRRAGSYNLPCFHSLFK
ncbi:MAG: hypothetical protein ACMG6E_06760 [Candidatus Roizmanbacteria bacterium]